MPDYIFGKNITRTFYALEDGEHIDLPSQAPAIYLFSNEPSLEDAINGTGAFDTITYWSESSISPYPRTYTIPAIDDPDPDSSTQSLGYWEAVRFLAKAGGQLQTKLRYFEIERAKALDSVPGTTITDIKNIYPAISSYATDNQLSEHLSNAERELKLEFKSQNIEWGNLSELGDLMLALAYKSIQLVAESQIESEGDKFDLRRAIYAEKYDKLIKLIKLPYDSDNDGEPDTTTEPSQSAGIVIINK